MSTTMRPVTFRPARPEDVDQVVPLMLESSKTLIDYTFRIGVRDPLTFLAFDFMRGKGIFGYLQQIVGVSESGAIVSTMTAYPGGRARVLTLHTAISAFRHFGLLGFTTFLMRSLAMANLFIPPPGEAIFLANGCVHERRRGTGVFSAFIAHVTEIARARGMRALALDVSFKNTSAQKQYEHLGFQTTAERPYTGNKPLDGFRRMEKRIA